MAYDAEHEYTPFERLRLVAEAVGSVKPEQINMESWQNECGTTACALGWGILKSGRELNMSLRRDERGVFVPWIGEESTHRFEMDRIIGAHFGLTATEEQNLFSCWRVDITYGTKNPSPATLRRVILEYADRAEARAMASAPA